MMEIDDELNKKKKTKELKTINIVEKIMKTHRIKKFLTSIK